jgi:hypothetical protein
MHLDDSGRGIAMKTSILFLCVISHVLSSGCSQNSENNRDTQASKNEIFPENASSTGEFSIQDENLAMGHTSNSQDEKSEARDPSSTGATQNSLAVSIPSTSSLKTILPSATSTPPMASEKARTPLFLLLDDFEAQQYGKIKFWHIPANLGPVLTPNVRQKRFSGNSSATWSLAKGTIERAYTPKLDLSSASDVTIWIFVPTLPSSAENQKLTVSFYNGTLSRSSTVPIASIENAWQRIRFSLSDTIEKESTPSWGSSWKEIDKISLSTNIGVDVLLDDFHASAPLRIPPHLLVDSKEFDRMQLRKNLPQWSGAFNGILLDAEAWPAKHQARFQLSGTIWQPPTSPQTPFGGGQWGHWPAPSTTDPNYEALMAIYRFAGRHGDAADMVVTLGLAYRITGLEKYAEAVRQILTTYADKYLTYAIHDVYGGTASTGARVHAQTLEDSFWIFEMAWGYDLIADWPGLTVGEHQKIFDQMFYPAAQLLYGKRVGPVSNEAGAIGNWQVHLNRGLAALAIVLQDPLILAGAITDPQTGFGAIQQNSILADGFWYEGSWGYHLYALTPMLYTIQMAERVGFDLSVLKDTPDSDQDIRGMFTLPLSLQMPNGVLPAFNDGGIGYLNSMYEFGYKWFGSQNPWLALPLNRIARSREGLLWGEDELPVLDSLSRSSLVLPISGYGVLRTTTPISSSNSQPDQKYVAMKFGPSGGGHGHFDKLGFIFFGAGQILGLDSGSRPYGVPEHATWDLTTVAHNTLAIDTKKQAAATGSLLDSMLLDKIGFVKADAGLAYPGVASFTRQMALLPDYVVDILDVASLDGNEHLYDFLYHNPAVSVSMTNGPAPSAYTLLDINNNPILATVDGYSNLKNTLSSTRADTWSARFSIDTSKKIYTIWSMLPASPAATPLLSTTVVLGTGLGMVGQPDAPFLLARRKTRSTTFTSLLETWSFATAPQTPPNPSLFQELSFGSTSFTAGLYGFKIQRTGDWQDWLLMDTRVTDSGPLEKTTADGLQCNGKLGYVRLDSQNQLVSFALGEGTSLQKMVLSRNIGLTSSIQIEDLRGEIAATHVQLFTKNHSQGPEIQVTLTVTQDVTKINSVTLNGTEMEVAKNPTTNSLSFSLP